MKKISKTEIIEEVAKNSGVAKKDTQKIVQTLLEAISDHLHEGDSVQFTGFGSFEVKERAAREGRNPKTGETIHIPASKAPAFKAGKDLKAAVNK